MRLERMLRLVAGVLVLASLGLARVHSPYWLLLTLFVGLNLFQSGFTDWCPMKTILQLAGVRSCEDELRDLRQRAEETTGHE